jgi:hypothetical protein
MQKVGFYLTLLVVGALIGASIVGYIAINQNPSIEEQVKVTIQGIQYETSDSVLKIELLNDAPEKNLEGKVFVSQDENQWTSEVTWYYTGYGTAEVICDSINETQNFRITYIENNSKVTYLDRIIEWNEVSQTFTFMDTEELKITSIAFTESVADAKDQITVYVQNTGTTDVTIQATVTVTGSGVTGGTTTSATVTKGGTGTFVVDLGTESWSEGVTYNVELLSSKGNKFSYTETA